MHQYTGNIHKVLRWTMISGIFALPLIALIVSTGLFFPYIVGKNFAFRIIVEVIFSAWVGMALIDSRYRLRWTPLLITITVFVGVVLLAGLLGENPYKSFWSNYERMDGTITLLHALAYVFVAQSVMATERLWLWFWRVSLAVSTGIALHTFIQFLNETGNGVRLYSTLGNPIYLAVYVLFHIFIALILAARTHAPQWERVLYLSTLPLLFFAVYLTSTRGASLGIIGGLVIAAIGIAWSKRADTQVVVTALVTLGVIATLIVGFFMMRDTSVVQNDPLLKRFASLSLSDASISARSMIWSMALQGAQERPLLGWGQENFNYVFNKYYNPNMYSLEQWYDRVHNVVLDWLIAAGALGLLAYLAIFMALLYALYRAKYFTVIQKWLILGMLSAYVVQNLTVFDQVVSYILFFSVVVWIDTFPRSAPAAHDGIRKKAKDNEADEEALHPIYGVALAVILVSGLVWSVNAHAYRANATLLQALQQKGNAMTLAQRGNVEQANKLLEASLQSFTRATAYHSYGDQEIDEQRVQQATTIMRAKWVSEAMKNKWYAAAVQGMQREGKRTPLDARFPFFEASAHAAAGQLEAQKSALLRASTLTPHKPMILVLLADNALRRNDTQEARTYAEQAYTLVPSYQTALEMYALVLLAQKDTKSFDVLIKREGVRIAEFPSIMSVLAQRNKYTLVHDLWEKSLTASSTPQQVFKLVALYATLKDLPRAQQAVRDGVAKYPVLKDIGKQISAKLVGEIQKNKQK